MSYFSLSRLTQLDIKWIGQSSGNLISVERFHSNPNYELLVAINEPIRLQIEQLELELKAGECLLLKPWEKHRVVKPHSESVEFFWVQFTIYPEPKEFPTLSGLTQSLLAESTSQELRTANNHASDNLIIPRYCKPLRRFEIFHTFEQILQESQTPSGYYRFRCSLYLGHVLEQIASSFLEKQKIDALVPAPFLNYRQIVNYLDEQYANEITSQAMEAKLQKNYGYLCQIFKKYSGTTIHSYIQQLRVQRAKYLLLSSNKEINEISYEVGCQDPYYFSRLFKKWEGVSPLVYRTQKRV